MQDFLQINTELYDWQAIAISKIKKEIFGDRRTSFDVSSYNKKDTKLVVVYGPPQIGKTTLILYLLGIDSKFEYKNRPEAGRFIYYSSSLFAILVATMSRAVLFLPPLMMISAYFLVGST